MWRAAPLAHITSLKLKVYHAITLRDLHHTFATTALAARADLKALMSATDHRTMAAADIYQSATEVRSISVAGMAAQSSDLKREHLSGNTSKKLKSRIRKKEIKAIT